MLCRGSGWLSSVSTKRMLHSMDGIPHLHQAWSLLVCDSRLVSSCVCSPGLLAPRLPPCAGWAGQGPWGTAVLLLLRQLRELILCAVLRERSRLPLHALWSASPKLLRDAGYRARLFDVRRSRRVLGAHRCYELCCLL